MADFPENTADVWSLHRRSSFCVSLVASEIQLLHRNHMHTLEVKYFENSFEENDSPW